MGRPSLDQIKEKVPESDLAATLQVRGKHVTRTREAMGKVFKENRCKAFTPQEIAQMADVSAKTVYLNLELLVTSGYIHHLPSLNLYFWCRQSRT